MGIGVAAETVDTRCFQSPFAKKGLTQASACPSKIARGAVYAKEFFISPPKNPLLPT
jgi:hypothetical protein